MLIAYYDNNHAERIHITNYKKELHKDHMFCAYGHAVVGKQGMKKSWHYAHVHAVDSECSRVMGEWHHWWQDRVFVDFLEIIIERDGKRHIADMINGNDVVVEFQKSVIPQQTIIAREEFYDNMIWVFYCVEHQMKVLKQHGRYMRIRMLRGSKFFLDARKPSFLDFDKRGVLEVIKIVNAHKAKPELYVKIWTANEFDEVFMHGCLKPTADTRVHRQPYVFEDLDVKFEDAEVVLRSK